MPTLVGVRYGFVLDQTKCIGCHACTVACKQENEVPLGVFRTWVKYIEKGAFPDTRRHFAVLRCNQCDDAPCVTICPTRALYRRPDAIVDFDSAACIGCKSCMQACPYDAIYIDPSENTAAKCNFCAHRVDQGLAPACEIVCPVGAIISGDLDDPASRVAQITSREPVQVRKPDQGTLPKVYYVGADATLLDPRIDRDVAPMYTDPGELKLEPADIGLTREVYDVVHEAPWGWRVWLYLWTKSVAAGVVMVAAFLALLHGGRIGLAPLAIGLLFTLATTALLILDLKRPERFWYLLVRPNFRSWLVWGGYVLGLWTLFCAGGVAAEASGVPPPGWVLVLAIALGAATAGYSAFLFNQAEGRDFWQSPALLWHLLVEAALCGSASLLLLRAGPPAALETALAASVALQILLILTELLERHGNLDVRRAAREITHRRLSRSFWWVVVTLGTSAPLLLLVARWLGAPALLSYVAAALALGGALEYGRLWVKAGQSVRLS